VLANEIDDAPPTIALLNVCERKCCHLGSSKPAAEKAPKPEAVTEETPAEETPAEEKPKTSTRRRTPAKKKEVSA